MPKSKAVFLKSKSIEQFRQTFEIHTVQRPKEGIELVVQVLCFSIDPIMIVWMSGAQSYYPSMKIGDMLHCFGLGRVLQSNNSGFSVGDLVFGNTGCTQIAYIDKSKLRNLSPIPNTLVQGFTPEQFVYLMNNGLAAYGGIDVMEGLKEGDTVVVSTAAGATGLLALQLLKYRKVKAIGLTSEIKREYIEKYCVKTVNYKEKEALEAVLKENKFKYYFDNVGEWLLDLAIKYIQPHGVLALCGATSNYLNYQHREGIRNYSAAISKRLTLRGFNFGMYLPQVFEIFEYFRKMKKEGHLDLKIDVTSIDRFSVQFRKLMRGDTLGKVIVKIEQPQPTAKL